MDVVVLDVRGGRHAAHPGVRRLRHSGAPAGGRVSDLSQQCPRAPSGVGAGHDRRVHRQCPPVASGVPAALRDRRRRPGRGPLHPADDPHRGVRPGRRPHRSGGGRPLRAPRGRVAAGVRTDRSRHRRRPRRGAAGLRHAGPARARPVRAPGGALRYRTVAGRAASDGRSAVVDGRCLPPGGGRRGTHRRRHRRPVHLSGRHRHGHERGRRHRGRGGPAHPPDVVQRRHGPRRSGRVHRGRRAGGGQRGVPSRAVLSHRLGVHLRRPGRPPAAEAAAGRRVPCSGPCPTGPCRRPTGSG